MSGCLCIQTSSSRMARLIGQVLDASRLHTGQGLEVRLQDIDMAHVVDDVLDEARVAYPGSALHCAGPSALAMRGDPDRLAQVVGNLVSNARHYGIAGEAVHVALTEEPDAVVLSVANTALAIDPVFVPHLFDAFKQQSAGQKRNKGGLGLGLHIALAVARTHSGNIT